MDIKSEFVKSKGTPLGHVDNQEFNGTTSVVWYKVVVTSAIVTRIFFPEEMRQTPVQIRTHEPPEPLAKWSGGLLSRAVTTS
jgi:hypothetical protein